METFDQLGPLPLVSIKVRKRLFYITISLFLRVYCVASFWPSMPVIAAEPIVCFVAAKGVEFPCVCLSLCLAVYQQDNLKSC